MGERAECVMLNKGPAIVEAVSLLDRLLAQELPEGWDADVTYWEPGSKAVATRAAFGQVLNDVAPKLPELWGGSADLAVRQPGHAGQTLGLEGLDLVLVAQRQAALFQASGQNVGQTVNA